MSTEGFVFAAVAQAIADSTPDGTDYRCRVWSDFELPAIGVDITVQVTSSPDHLSVRRFLPLLTLVHANDPRVAVRHFAASVTLPLRLYYQQQQAAPEQSAPPSQTTES